MTLNEIITNTTKLTNAEKHTLRDILQEELNCTLCSKISRIIADKLWTAINVSYSLWDKFFDLLIRKE